MRPKAFWADADGGSSQQGDIDGTVSLGDELNFAAPSTLTQWSPAGLTRLHVIDCWAIPGSAIA